MYEDYGYSTMIDISPKPNLITGEGRMKYRAHKDKQPDLKKHKHRKMAKKSKRVNRR